MRGWPRACAAIWCALVLAGCAEEATFPNQIPEVVASLGRFHEAWSRRDPAAFDSVCADRELYPALLAVFEADSLAVLTRRIHNPIDSAAVVMTVGRLASGGGEVRQRFTLELFMRREGDRFWIVAHRLDRSLP